MANGLTPYQQQYGATGGGLFGGGQASNQQLLGSGWNNVNYATQNPALQSGYFAGYTPTTATAANVNQSGGQPYSNAQLGLMSQLQGEANGTGGPTVADLQQQQATQGALATQLAATAGARGQQNPGAAAYQVGQNQAAQAQMGAGQAAALRANEQISAQSALAGLTGQGIGQAQNQAALTQQAALANQEVQNQAAMFGAQSQQNYANLANQNWQFGTGLNANENNAYNQAIYGLTSQNQAQDASAVTSGLNDLTSMSDTILGKKLSDENAKSHIEKSSDAIQKFLSALDDGQHSYEYKDPGAPGAEPGEHFGPMAQEIENGGEVGKSVVQQGPDGMKHVDTPSLTMALASGMGQLHKRLEGIEQGMAHLMRGRRTA